MALDHTSYVQGSASMLFCIATKFDMKNTDDMTYVSPLPSLSVSKHTKDTITLMCKWQNMVARVNVASNPGWCWQLVRE